MASKENNFNNFEHNNNANNIKKKENIIKRIISSPALQRILLATLLTVFTPSDFKKDDADSKKDIEKKEVLDTKLVSHPQDSLIVGDSLYNESLSDEEYEANTKTKYPMVERSKEKK